MTFYQVLLLLKYNNLFFDNKWTFCYTVFSFLTKRSFKMTYRIEVFGYLTNDTTLVHLFGLENLSLTEVLSEIADLNKDNYVYRIVEETI